MGDPKATAAGAARLAITVTAVAVRTILLIVCFRFIIFDSPFGSLCGRSCAACKKKNGASDTVGDQPWG